LAVSGGADSAVLSHLFRVSGFEFQIAHVNYHFRGEDSNLDQKIVEDFVRKTTLNFI
jgi:tRNA(Ile)-lysidine synthase